jgi:CubicO group peptidase (beta-lactamase class C family)
MASEVQGTCDPRFEAVREALAASLDGKDVGASAAVFVDGQPVADLWGGYIDADRTQPWQQDTIVNVWSTTKPMAALCVLILADRGEVDLDAPLARYWPEFAHAGKESVLVRHVLSHMAGLPTWDEPMTVDGLYDWTTATARLAAQPTRWEPGTAAGYHAVTQGYLLGELVRRVTGRGLGEFFAEEVAGPLGADFHIGLPERHDHRVAPVIAPPATPLTEQLIAGQFGANPVMLPEGPTRSRGGGPGSRRLVGSATPARWLWCSRCCRVAAPSVAYACSPRRAASRLGASSSAVRISSSAYG